MRRSQAFARTEILRLRPQNDTTCGRHLSPLPVRRERALRRAKWLQRALPPLVKARDKSCAGTFSDEPNCPYGSGETTSMTEEMAAYPKTSGAWAFAAGASHGERFSIGATCPHGQAIHKGETAIEHAATVPIERARGIAIGQPTVHTERRIGRVTDTALGGRGAQAGGGLPSFRFLPFFLAAAIPHEEYWVFLPPSLMAGGGRRKAHEGLESIELGKDGKHFGYTENPSPASGSTGEGLG